MQDYKRLLNLFNLTESIRPQSVLDLTQLSIAESINAIVKALEHTYPGVFGFIDSRFQQRLRMPNSFSQLEDWIKDACIYIETSNKNSNKKRIDHTKMSSVNANSVNEYPDLQNTRIIDQFTNPYNRYNNNRNGRGNTNNNCRDKFNNYRGGYRGYSGNSRGYYTNNNNNTNRNYNNNSRFGQIQTNNDEQHHYNRGQYNYRSQSTNYRGRGQGRGRGRCRGRGSGQRNYNSKSNTPRYVAQECEKCGVWGDHKGICYWITNSFPFLLIDFANMNPNNQKSNL